MKHACYRLLRLLAARVFHTIIVFRRKVVLEQSQQAGFLTSWILDSSCWIPDSMSWIPDSKVVDSEFHGIKLPGFRITSHGATQETVSLTMRQFLSSLRQDQGQIQPL